RMRGARPLAIDDAMEVLRIRDVRRLHARLPPRSRLDECLRASLKEAGALREAARRAPRIR
ncbi:MAG TPA: hypothetical protein VFJ86_02005, partial [Usitatibacter sp.]|nr:hypothetical protein [Usitatibacter sp.]